MSLTYPSPSDNKQGKMVGVKFDVESNKMITEGANITLTNIEGYLLTGTYRDGYLVSSPDISMVEIGFDKARPEYGATVATSDKTGQIINRQYNSLSVGLIPKKGADYSSPVIPLETFWNKPLYFPVAGDYTPSMIVHCHNGSLVEYIDKEQKLHVYSASEIQAQALNQINGLIAIFLLVLSFIEAIKLVIDLTNK